MDQAESADIQALRRLLEADREASELADVDGMMALRTDDFVSMPPNQSAVEGSQAFRQFLGQMFGAFKPSSVSFVWKDLVASGDLAFARGEFEWTMIPTSGGEPIADSGKLMLVIRRQGDGTWKLARAIWNSDGAG